MIEWALEHKEELQTTASIALRQLDIGLTFWINQMQKETTPANELALFCLSRGVTGKPIDVTPNSTVTPIKKRNRRSKVTHRGEMVRCKTSLGQKEAKTRPVKDPFS